jgi:hypothetical protein
MNYTTTAEDIINAVIQDGQVQTTNRGTLLNYVNRVSMRMLRESQWLFLRSEQQLFMTQPDAAQYWIGQGQPPAGCVNTGLELSDIYGVIPDSIYDLTNARRLTQDSQSVLIGYNLRYKDASYRAAQPRTYNYDPNVYGILSLYPPPDNENLFNPIPNSPVCNYVQGGSIATTRTYYTLVTLVDSDGGESVPCYQPSITTVPSGHLLTVNSPTLEVTSASLTAYPYYNVYVSNTTGNSGTFYLQNSAPVPSNTIWTEPLTGIGNNTAPASSINLQNSLGQTYTLGVAPGGQLITTFQSYPSSGFPTYLKDSSNYTWLVSVNDLGEATTTKLYSAVAPQLILSDTTGQNWIVGVSTGGLLTTTTTGELAPSIIQPPQTSTVCPLYGYVVSFYYQKQRLQITASTDILQIPDQYFDVAVAGVNYYANLYTSKGDDINVKAGAWKREFMEGLAQMRRDLRINFRNTDVIMPDPATQYQIGTQSGYSYYAV